MAAAAGFTRSAFSCLMHGCSAWMGVVRFQAVVLALLGFVMGHPAGAVVVLDSAWADAGGRKGAEAAGFAAHEALAHEAQFAAIFGLWDGAEYTGSATWIGNDSAGHGWLLTAAHNFDDGAAVEDFTFYSRAGGDYAGEEVFLHPRYDESDQEQESSGYDMALVRLDRAVTDSGEAPMLYAGSDELGRVLTITGFGSRGIGSTGEEDRFYDFDAPGPAAATNIIDEVDGEMENNLIIDFDDEAGAQNVTGEAGPLDALEGILGSGDSGGAAWIETPDGWAIAGVNTWGDGSTYGSISGFGRVSTQLDWIAGHFPDFWITE
jgi:hypothetical protein